jgi:S1-C subfamily serine protease
MRLFALTPRRKVMLRTTILSAVAGLAMLPLAQAQQPFRLRLTEAKENVKENVKEAETPAYWIGLALRDTDPSLLAHLGLEHGVLVGEVMADSPAAKAGLQSLDIITRAGEADIKSGEDLLKAVATAKDSELKLTLYRKGAEQAIKVTPAKRPPEDRVAVAPPVDPKGEAVENALRLWKHAQPLEFSFVQPGVVLKLETPSLPDDMSVDVHREGKQPAKITVKQGDKSWTASNEKEIDTLPEASRPIVRQMLGMPVDQAFWRVDPQHVPTTPAAPHVRVLPPRVDARDPREVRESREVLERIDAELKKLQEQLDQLRQDKGAK